MPAGKPYFKTNFTAYLGGAEKRQQRMARIQKIADGLTDGNVSRLIQQIADGDLVITRPVA